MVPSQVAPGEQSPAFWQLPAATLEIEPGPIHLWHAHCPTAPFDAEACVAHLTPSEQARAARLATPRLQRRFLQAHTLLHQLLRAYCGVDALPYELAYHAHGKPYLISPQLEPPLEFNMSHAGEVVLVAICRGFAVGVDVERMRTLDDLDSLIKTICTPREQAYLTNLSPDARQKEFYRLWTRKEACLKLYGDGIGKGLTTTDVLDDPHGIQLLDLAYSGPAVEGEQGRGKAHYAGTLARPTTVDMSIQHFEAVWQ